MVSLRLTRQGSKDRPYYKIVAIDSRKRRDGRCIEQLGTYDPMQEGVNYKIDLEKADKWIGHGAKPLVTVASIIKISIIEVRHYRSAFALPEATQEPDRLP